MRIAACIIRAVAAKEIGACRNSGIRDGVGEVAVVAGVAVAMEKVLANGNLFRIVGEFTRQATRTVP